MNALIAKLSPAAQDTLAGVGFVMMGVATCGAMFGAIYAPVLFR